MEHLIANSGIQFITCNVSFDPTQPLLIGHKILKNTFCLVNDMITGEKRLSVALCHDKSGLYVPFNVVDGTDAVCEEPDGRMMLDISGTAVLEDDIQINLYETVNPNSDSLISMNTLSRYRIKNNGELIPAFDALLGKWLPMPMYGCDTTTGQPIDVAWGWCRMKIERIDDKNNYQIVWAFDTKTNIEFDINATEAQMAMRPNLCGQSKQRFAICDRADLILEFLNNDYNNGSFAQYIKDLLNVSDPCDYNYMVYYVYLVNFIRLLNYPEAFEVTLNNYDDPHYRRPVDLVLDIGNSRTCGVLFEDEDFTKGIMLTLQDLTHPELCYSEPFDMRLVFRQADFGNNMTSETELFTWNSIVRVGKEAQHLIYNAAQDDSLTAKATYYSSPKRYLWDKEKYHDKWENLITDTDPLHIANSRNIYIPNFTDMFADDGTFEPSGAETSNEKRYSRSSLMTFVMVEIFNQALLQINSVPFRQKHGGIDSKRYLRNIIVTCPTAMPLNEQVTLRKCASEAYNILQQTTEIPNITVIPDYNKLLADKFDSESERTWVYDEAMCCQLVYLYAEIGYRYNGEGHRFFNAYGHGTGRGITIGSIDIGAGTTDVMICHYDKTTSGNCILHPKPLFWDSFYLAGDDMMRDIIQNIIIEGADNDSTKLGSIGSALRNRLLESSNEALREMPCATDPVYKQKIDDIIHSYTDKERKTRLLSFASILLGDYFGTDSAHMSFADRRCRLDFNTQISLPLAQFMLEQLRRHRPRQTFSFEDIFTDNKPVAHLLDHFANHFGFRFEDLLWSYEPELLAERVQTSFKTLMRQLSQILYVHHCDIVILGGRPTSLDAITDLVVEYLPVTPDRIIQFNNYRVGRWYPFSDGEGNINDPKSAVAVGAMIGYLTSRQGGSKGMTIDFSELIDTMQSTAKYIGVYDHNRRQIKEILLSPDNNNAILKQALFPLILGCKQYPSEYYQARPLYAIYNNSGKTPLEIFISRDYTCSREQIEIDSVTDSEGRNLKQQVKIIQQSISIGGGAKDNSVALYWLDKGEFELTKTM